MQPDAIFGLANSSAMLGWIILIAAPRQWPGLGLVPRWLVPVALAAVYSALVPVHFAATGGGYGSISEVRLLFASDPMLVAGWIHYLAFDLLVGAMVADRMDRAGVHRLVQAAPLATVFLFGPMGLLLGLLVEFATRQLAPRLGSASR